MDFYTLAWRACWIRLNEWKPIKLRGILKRRGMNRVEVQKMSPLFIIAMMEQILSEHKSHLRTKYRCPLTSINKTARNQWIVCNLFIFFNSNANTTSFIFTPFLIKSVEVPNHVWRWLALLVCFRCLFCPFLSTSSPWEPILDTRFAMHAPPLCHCSALEPTLVLSWRRLFRNETFLRIEKLPCCKRGRKTLAGEECAPNNGTSFWLRLSVVCLLCFDTLNICDGFPHDARATFIWITIRGVHAKELWENWRTEFAVEEEDALEMAWKTEAV